MKSSTSGLAGALAVIAAALFVPGGLPAASITYNFTENGWQNNAGTSENLSGSFTGTPDANGILNLSALSAFSATLTETNTANETKAIAQFGSVGGIAGLTDFVFDPNNPGLVLAATGSPGAQVCLGSAVQAGFCGPVAAPPQPRPGTPPLPALEGLFLSSVNGNLNASTFALPGVVQVSPVVIMPVPRANNTPEPGSMLLCGTALLVTGMFLRRWRRRAAAARIEAHDFAEHRACNRVARSHRGN